MLDFCINNDIPQISNSVDIVVQQIELFMDTWIDEVLGEDCGQDFDRFLFDTSVGNNATASYISNVIHNHVNLLDWSLDVGVDYLLGTQNDILMVYLTLSREGASYTKVYRMTEGSISPVY